MKRSFSRKQLFATTAVLTALLCAHHLAAQNTEIYSNVTNPENAAKHPTSKTDFTLSSATQITEIVTSHRNEGKGAKAGKITLQLQKPNGQREKFVFTTHVVRDEKNPSNVNWVATVDKKLPPGHYYVVDSDPRTWLHNEQSYHRGFVVVRGQPGPHCEDISAAGGNGPSIQQVYRCVSNTLCTPNYFNAQSVATDYCSATNQSTCKSDDCDSCHGVVRGNPAFGEPKVTFIPDKDCKHDGEGTCVVNVPVPGGGISCDCHC